MNKPVTAFCNHCGKITDVVLKQKHHPNNVQETYFKCEFCYYHYTSFVTDGRVRKLQRKKDKLIGDHYIHKRLVLQEQINERMSWLKYNQVQFGRADL